MKVVGHPVQIRFPWTTHVVQEAICFGDANILTSGLEVRDLQRHIK